MTKRRTRYIVQTTYTCVRKYEVLAADIEEAKSMVRNGLVKHNECVQFDETHNVDYAYRKENR